MERAGASGETRRSVERLALSKAEAAEALGVSVDFLEEHEVAEQWLQDAAAGTVLNRSGDRYKPSVVRGYEQALRTYVLPDLGAVQLGALQRRDVQALAERIARSGKSPSTVRNALLPLRAICRRALARGEIHDNPTRGLELPAVRGRRDRIAEPREAAALLSALETKDRRLWATAIYAGLRRGELQALRWGDVDLDASVIRVRRSWDRVAGEIEPKSAAGTRAAPSRPYFGRTSSRQERNRTSCSAARATGPSCRGRSPSAPAARGARQG